MGQYFFHLRVDGRLAEDMEGRDLPGIRAAHNEALIILTAAIREMESGFIDFHNVSLEISNRNGNLLISVPSEELDLSL